MTDTIKYNVYYKKGGGVTLRPTKEHLTFEVLGNESYQRKREDTVAIYWGVELNNKLKHITTSRDAARMFRREKCPSARVVALG